MEQIRLASLGELSPDDGWLSLPKCSDGCFTAGKDGVTHIVSTGDRKVELIGFEGRTLAYIKSDMGYPAYYPVPEVEKTRPAKAVLMDLDGTTVRSEEFWIGIIEQTVASLLKNPRFSFEESDLPFVSGHSVSEHLQYCIKKYCPKAALSVARDVYFSHTNREMALILAGKGRKGAFTPNEGVKDFLLELKARNIKIGLVTSGLYEKAYPEILSAFETMGLHDPKEFYDCIITAGSALRKGGAGTLGELEPKPHPWLYAEAGRVGLNIPQKERGSVVGIEDSGAGVCSLRLAGYFTVGIAGGNIVASGARGMCGAYCERFEEILNYL